MQQQQNAAMMSHHFHHHHHHLHAGRDRPPNANDVQQQQQQQQQFMFPDMSQLVPSHALPHAHRNVHQFVPGTDFNAQSMIGLPVMATNQYMSRPPNAANVYGLPNNLPMVSAAYNVPPVLTSFPSSSSSSMSVVNQNQQAALAYQQHLLRTHVLPPPPPPPPPGLLPFLVNPAVAAQQYVNFTAACTNSQPRLHMPPHQQGIRF